MFLTGLVSTVAIARAAEKQIPKFVSDESKFPNRQTAELHLAFSAT